MTNIKKRKILVCNYQLTAYDEDLFHKTTKCPTSPISLLDKKQNQSKRNCINWRSRRQETRRAKKRKKSDDGKASGGGMGYVERLIRGGASRSRWYSDHVTCPGDVTTSTADVRVWEYKALLLALTAYTLCDDDVRSPGALEFSWNLLQAESDRFNTDSELPLLRPFSTTNEMISLILYNYNNIGLNTTSYTNWGIQNNDLIFASHL